MADAQRRKVAEMEILNRIQQAQASGEFEAAELLVMAANITGAIVAMFGDPQMDVIAMDAVAKAMVGRLQIIRDYMKEDGNG